MLLTLTPHPDTPCDAVQRIDVHVTRPRARGLALTYRVAGDIDDVRWPAIVDEKMGSRADELWRSTCLEAFVSAGAGYYEFNLSPSGEWAVYRFNGYRSGMTSAAGAELYTLEAGRNDGGFELSAELDLDGLSHLLPGQPWRLGLSAVIEESDGRKSYWALSHAPGRPDFHHPDSFAALVPDLEIP